MPPAEGVGERTAHRPLPTAAPFCECPVAPPLSHRIDPTASQLPALLWLLRSWAWGSAPSTVLSSAPTARAAVPPLHLQVPQPSSADHGHPQIQAAAVALRKRTTDFLCDCGRISQRGTETGGLRAGRMVEFQTTLEEGWESRLGKHQGAGKAQLSFCGTEPRWGPSQRLGLPPSRGRREDLLGADSKQTGRGQKPPPTGNAARGWESSPTDALPLPCTAAAAPAQGRVRVARAVSPALRGSGAPTGSRSSTTPPPGGGDATPAPCKLSQKQQRTAHPVPSSLWFAGTEGRLWPSEASVCTLMR